MPRRVSRRLRLVSRAIVYQPGEVIDSAYCTWYGMFRAARHPFVVVLFDNFVETFGGGRKAFFRNRGAKALLSL